MLKRPAGRTQFAIHLIIAFLVVTHLAPQLRIGLKAMQLQFHVSIARGLIYAALRAKIRSGWMIEVGMRRHE
jgi:hypothetical protein